MNANVYILMKVRLNPISSLHDGWSPFGEKIFGISLRKREKNINIIAALNKQTVVAPFIYEGSMNTDLFNKEEFLLPVLEPGQIIVMDNAGFHQSIETE